MWQHLHNVSTIRPGDTLACYWNVKRPNKQTNQKKQKKQNKTKHNRQQQEQHNDDDNNNNNNNSNYDEDNNSGVGQTNSGIPSNSKGRIALRHRRVRYARHPSIFAVKDPEQGRLCWPHDLLPPSNEADMHLSIRFKHRMEIYFPAPPQLTCFCGARGWCRGVSWPPPSLWGLSLRTGILHFCRSLCCYCVFLVYVFI